MASNQGGMRGTADAALAAGSVLALLLLTLHFGSFDFRSQPLVTDARYYAYMSWRVTEGDVPHRDLFDNKTQLATYSGALSIWLGRVFSLDPLIAIRVGHLALGVLGGLLSFAVFRRLAGTTGGLLSVAAYCSFGFLAVMPSIGNIPKLWMPVAATAAALLVARARWFWAGFAGGIAFMDWQIGFLVWIAALLSAVVLERRMRPALQVALGGAAALAPFVVYYAASGALTATFSQVVVASLFRGSEVAQVSDLGRRLASIANAARLSSGPQAWLFFVSALGAPVASWWLWRWREGQRELLLPLLVYHLGVVAFSLTDFQWYGDFFLLLHSAAFFLAVLWVAVWQSAQARTSGLDARGQIAVAALVCLLAVGLARPGPLHPRVPLRRVKPAIHPEATLADQREVAAAVAERARGRRIAFLEHSEMLFLMPRENALPVFFWNRPTWVSLRSSPEETVVEAAARMVRSVDAEMVVVPPARTRRFFDPVSGQIDAIQVDYAPVLDGLDIESVASANGRVRVTYGVRPRDTEALSIDPERVEALRALGYAEVGEPLAEGVEVGVRLFDRSRARPGLNLFTDAKACATHLMDMEGQVLHSWSGSPCHRWDNTVLLANGDLLVTARETKGRSPAEADAARALLRLGWSGELRWKRRLTAHHDVEVTPSGRILLMAHRFRSIPEVHPEVPVRDHLLLLLSEEGEPIEERSLWDVLQTRPDLLPLQRIRPRRFEGSREVDLFHSNSVEWMRHPQLIGRDPIYGEDTVLVSIRNQDAFVVFAWETEELLWVWGPGEVSNPHDATLLPNGHVLAFDNGLGRGWSRVIEVDPLSREIVWQYRAPDPTDFYSRTRGASQRLSRGHVLITESDTGRAFEVTPEGEIVWEFVNPDLTPEREPGVIVRMRRLEGIDFPELLSRLERGEALPLTD